MNINEHLIEVSIDDGTTFVIPSFHSLPLTKLLPIMSVPADLQIPVIVSLVRELIAQDRWDDFDSLNIVQMEKLVNNWIQATEPKKEETVSDLFFTPKKKFGWFRKKRKNDS